jgi:hypothetical protein
MKAFLVVLSLAAAAAAAPERRALSELVPAETLVCFETDDLGGVAAWSRETALGRIWSEPEVQAFAGPLLARAREALGRIAGERGPFRFAGLSLDDFSGIAVRRAGIAVVDAGVEEGPRLDLVAALEFREGVDRARAVVAKLREAATNVGLWVVETEVMGRRMWSMPTPLFDLHFGFLDDRFLLATSRARMEATLAAAGGGPGPSLASAPRFARAIAASAAERFAFRLYADVPRVYARVVRAMSLTQAAEHAENVDAKWRALGMDAVESFLAAEMPQGTGFRTEIAFTMTERRGYWGLYQKARPSHRLARHAPRHALAYGAESGDVAVLFDKLLEVTASLDEEVGAEARAGVAAANEFLGIDLRDHVAAALGTEFAWYLGAPPGGGLVPDLVFCAAVRDRETLERALLAAFERARAHAAEEGVQLTLREGTFRGVTIRTAEIARRGEVVPIAPSWAFSEDALLVALIPQSLKHALLEKPSLDGNPAFQEALRALPAGAASATYLDLPALATWVYNTLVPFAQALQGGANAELRRFGVTLDFHGLPLAETIARHLAPLVTYTVVEERAVRMGMVSSFGAATLLVPAASFAIPGALLFARRAMEERETAELRELEARIRQLEAELEALRARLETENGLDAEGEEEEAAGGAD